MAPAAARNIISDGNIGAMARPSNSYPRRMLGGVRTLSARIFARLRKGARNLVAQNLARCGSNVFARFAWGKLDCAHEFKLNPCWTVVNVWRVANRMHLYTPQYLSDAILAIAPTKVWCVPFGPGSRRVRARSRSTDHGFPHHEPVASPPGRVTIPDAGRRTRRARRARPDEFSRSLTWA
jgi:hypothetical protein